MHHALPDDIASYPQPPSNTKGSVDAAIDKLIMAASEDEAAKFGPPLIIATQKRI